VFWRIAFALPSKLFHDGFELLAVYAAYCLFCGIDATCCSSTLIYTTPRVQAYIVSFKSNYQGPERFPYGVRDVVKFQRRQLATQMSSAINSSDLFFCAFFPSGAGRRSGTAWCTAGGSRITHDAYAAHSMLTSGPRCRKPACDVETNRPHLRRHNECLRSFGRATCLTDRV
jgi:hypothetical protein